MNREKNIEIPVRPRRNRKNSATRNLVRETSVTPADLILPLFVVEGEGQMIPVDSMPGCFRMSPDKVLKKAKEAFSLGIPAVALFPGS